MLYQIDSMANFQTAGLADLVVVPGLQRGLEANWGGGPAFSSKKSRVIISIPLNTWNGRKGYRVAKEKGSLEWRFATVVQG